MKGKRIVASILAMLIGFSLFSCKEEGSGNANSSSSGMDSHEEIKESGENLLMNAQTDYKILYPESASQKERTAVDELESFFMEATGVQLEKISDGENGFQSNGKYISVGNTTLAQSGIEVGKELGYGGFVLKTVGDDIIVCGYEETGTLNGVYKLLELLFDYDYFFLDSYHINKDVRDVTLKLYDIKEIPDIQYNSNAYNWLTTEAKNRYGYTIPDWQIGSLVGHNSFIYVNPEEYLSEHSGWFDNATTPTQLCYTAHGDATEYDLMVEAAFKTLQTELIENPDPEQTRVTFAIEDNGYYCKCSACNAELIKYGTNAAAMVKFLNALKLRADAWFETEEGKPYARDLIISFYAYLNYKNPPTKLVDGQYVAIDDSVKCVDGVEPRYAWLHGDYTVPLDHERNYVAVEMIEGWRAVADKISLYLYNTNYHHYLAPYNSFNALRGNLQLAKKYGIDYVYTLSQHTQTGYSTGYNALNAYLISKLGKDADADVNALTDKFFKYYFGEASSAMYKQFTEWRVWSLHLENDFGDAGYRGVFTDPINAEFFPKPLLEKWIGYCDEALQAIAPLKDTDPEKYATFYDHIVGERLSTWYLYVEIYQKSIPEKELLPIKREFKEDFERLGMSRVTETENISSLWAAWGI